MNGKYVCNELVFNILVMEYEVIGRITGKKCMYIYSFEWGLNLNYENR